jgi:hypothetical protein
VNLGAEVMALTQNIGVDYAFETAGIAKLIESSLALTRSGGMTVCVGAPPLEDKVTIENVVIFASMEKKLCGCLLGSCNSLREIPRMLALWRAGQLDLEGLITARRPLAEVNEGFADMKAAAASAPSSRSERPVGRHSCGRVPVDSSCRRHEWRPTAGRPARRSPQPKPRPAAPRPPPRPRASPRDRSTRSTLRA